MRLNVNCVARNKLNFRIKKIEVATSKKGSNNIWIQILTSGTWLNSENYTNFCEKLYVQNFHYYFDIDKDCF